MRFTAERDDFLTAVKRASGPIAARHVIPILACVHIAATDTGVKIRGTNLDEWVTVRMTAAVTQSGAICVNAALLSAWLAATSKGALVDFKVEAERAVLSAGRATSSFHTFATDQFANPPERDAKTEIPRGVEGVRACAAYASDEEVKYYLNGVAINRGHAVATNGHILCALNIAAPEDVDAIIPNAGVREIARSGDTARLFIGANTWACEDGNTVAGGKLIDGNFPDWKRALPSAPPRVATLDADTLAEAIKQVQVASGDRAKVIVMEADGAEVAISCRGDVMDAQARVAYDGPSFRVGMNSRYALAAADTFSGRVVHLAQQDARSPILLTSDSAPDLLACVYPLRV